MIKGSDNNLAELFTLNGMHGTFYPRQKIFVVAKTRFVSFFIQHTTDLIKFKQHEGLY